MQFACDDFICINFFTMYFKYSKTRHNLPIVKLRISNAMYKTEILSSKMCSSYRGLLGHDFDEIIILKCLNG